jgi:hypothetical protein
MEKVSGIKKTDSKRTIGINQEPKDKGVTK